MSEQMILTKMSLDLMPRPPRGMESTLKQAAETIATRLVDDCGWLLDDELIKDLCEAYQYIYPHDGFQMAKRLDAMSYELDAAAVEVLDGFATEEETIYDRKVKAWARSVDFTPRFAVGDGVKVQNKGKLHDGFIRTIKPESWQYIVRIPALGHVEYGVGTHGIYVNCEELDKYNAELTEEVKNENS